jgi:hypothetical protein
MYKQKILFACLLLFTAVSAVPAQQADSVVFRFTTRNDMFFLRGNEAELERLYNFTDKYLTEITSGQMPVHVDGYCSDLQIARIRSNRVKSELIVNKGLKEEHFITRNYAESYRGEKEAVIVSFMAKVKETEATDQPKPEQKPQPQPERKPATPPAQPVKEPQPELQPATPAVSGGDSGKFSLRTNLLYWAVATPNLGMEWKPSNSFGILVNGVWSHWIWSGEGRHHRTWLIQPEIRYYLGCRDGVCPVSTGWFLGIEGHAGEFNFKFGDTGYQGDVLGGGLTGGYRLRLSKCFDMDFSLGLGYTQLKYDTYYRSNDVMVRKESGLEKNVFAPTQAGISLIWKIK